MFKEGVSIAEVNTWKATEGKTFSKTNDYTPKVLIFSSSRQEAFFEEMSGDPVFCRKIIAGLAQRLHLLMADVESYSLRSGRDRVIGYLLREEERDGDCVAEGQVSIRLPTSKGTIASRLNLTQEHFSRILSELTGAGLIQVEGRTIHIPDIGRLRKSLG